MDKKLYIAADSGGSKTVWTVIGENGDIIKKYVTIGLGAAKEGTLPVAETVADAFEKLSDVGMLSGIFLSLGGPNVSEVQSAIKGCAKGVPVKVEREACGNSMLYAARFLDCSAVVMCGTGSVAVGDTKNGRKYSGGWGPVYGDGGSGGGMGSDALRIFLRSIDTNKDIGKLASLFGHLKEDLDITTFEGRMELKSRAINMSRRELASLAPRIYKLAEDGDAASYGLYESAAIEIADLAYGVSDDLGDFGVLLCGGFFAGKPMLLEMSERLFAKMSRARLIYEPRFSPIVAAQISVLRENGVKVTHAMFDKILNDL